MDSKILEILVKHSIAPSAALLEAMRDVYNAGAASNAPSNNAGGDDEDDDASSGPMSLADAAALKRLGIDVSKKFRSGRTTFTVTGYKPNRWKYPVSCVNQNGRRFKFTVASVVAHQRNS
jgi:hypothetical protein